MLICACARAAVFLVWIGGSAAAAIVWERASQLSRRQRDASLAHLTPDEIALHPRGHALLEAP